MSFISFNLKFYKEELKSLENSAVNDGTIYRTRQLLKILDDLLDEGYAELDGELEKAGCGASVLRAYLRDNNAKPFSVFRKPFSEMDVGYGRRSYELSRAIERLTADASESRNACDNAFLAELVRFCKWIGYEENTAYVFLLRDTLIPYVYFQSKDRKNIYPWLLSRRMLAALTGTGDADDKIRAAVFRALDSGKCGNFKEFCAAVLPDMRAALKHYPEAEKCLATLLGQIRQKRVIVIESGCSGTFPLLLMSLDDRIDFRMFTAYPYLLEIYGDKIYSDKYE